MFYFIIFPIFLVVAIVTIYASWIGAPIFLSNKQIIREALEFLKVDKETRFCDLGAGTGRMMILANKEFGAEVSGFELSPVYFLFAKLNLFLNKVKKPKLKMANFYNSNLGEVDTVFCFLGIKAMNRLEKKFKKELKPGTKIVSYSFEIKNRKPIKILSGKCPGKVFIYEV